MFVVVLLDRVDIGGRDGLTVGADHEDLALIGNTDRGAGKGDGAVDNSVILVRGIGGHILHRGVSSAGSGGSVGIIAGNQAVDALAVLVSWLAMVAVILFAVVAAILTLVISPPMMASYS